MVELAQELIDVIIKHTATENKDSSCSGTWWRPTDRSTLTACARVTHAFLVPSQRCLFRPPEIEFNARELCARYLLKIRSSRRPKQLPCRTKAHGKLKKPGHHGNGPAKASQGGKPEKGKKCGPELGRNRG
ncbi:hypothetical protein B0H14DRAFT_2598290 [Mycena olivaceomarginata]|nr:hypothetical protein B0H14DRAFT_2598290 [Mycena olivaceomarginata]